MWGPRSSIGSTASRISEHRSLLEENPEGAVDCLLQRWTAGACGAAEYHATLKRSRSVPVDVSPMVLFQSRPRVKRIPIRSGEWIPDEVNSDKSDEDVVDADIATIPSAQFYEQSEERYKAQAKQMMSSRNWIIESYGARLHLLIKGTASGDTEAFQNLKDLLEKMLVDLYWEIGFEDSASEPLSAASRGSSGGPEDRPGPKSSTARGSSPLSDTKKHQFWHFRSSKQSSSGPHKADTITRASGKPIVVKVLYTMLRRYDKAGTSDSGYRTGTTDSDQITVSESTTDCADYPPRPCPVTNMVDRLARSNLHAIPPLGGQAHAQLSQTLYDRKRNIFSWKLGERAVSKNSPSSSFELNGA